MRTSPHKVAGLGGVDETLTPDVLVLPSYTTSAIDYGCFTSHVWR